MDIYRDFNQAMNLCQKQKFQEAIKILEKIVIDYPTFADAWRNMAQAKMMLGRIDEAIADNEKALQHDPSNSWALILMGNLYLRKQELDKAMSYYEKVVEFHPKDVLALNNIAATYSKMSRFEESIRTFAKALEADSTYMNTYMGIAYCYLQKGDVKLAFEYAQDGLKYGKVRSENIDTYTSLQKMLLDCAKHLTQNGNYENELQAERAKLEKDGQLPIRFTKDDTLSVYAQMRYAKVRNRGYHEIVYNPSKGKLLPHLFMHELMHLEMNIAASNRGDNCFVVTKDSQFNELKSKYAKYLDKMRDQIGRENADKLFDQIIKGILLQVMNCGLDMLVEKKIYEEHTTLRPVQVVSLYNMLTEYVQSVKDAELSGNFPKDIVAANKIMNIATAMHFKDLYQIDLVPKFKATPNELKTAQHIYDEYLNYEDKGYNPGEEYDFVYTVAALFDFEDYLEFVPEEDATEEDFYHRLQNDINKQLKDHPVSGDSLVVNEINRDFRDEHSNNPAETMMMSMYMLGAMEYFDGFELDEVHKIAMDIAVVGMGGINPNNKGYKVKSIPDREFGGYELLAYYYVSFARAVPHLLQKLGLPFADAYESALQLYNAKHNL